MNSKCDDGDDKNNKCETKLQRSLASIEQRNAQIRRVQTIQTQLSHKLNFNASNEYICFCFFGMYFSIGN